MNATEIIQAASEAKPELMEKVAQAIYVLERIDPAFAADLTSEVETIISYTSEKTAEKGAMGAGLKPWAAAVGGTLAAGLMGAVATDLYDAAKRKLTSGMNYKRILEANPDLKKQYSAKQLKSSFDTFHRYAPDFTSDPNLGGQILKSMAEIPENQHQIVKDLLNSRNNLSNVKDRQFKPMVQSQLSLRSSVDEAERREQVQAVVMASQRNKENLVQEMEKMKQKYEFELAHP